MSRPLGRPKGYLLDHVQLILQNGTKSPQHFNPLWCDHLHRITTASWTVLRQTIQMDLKGHIEWTSPQGNVYRVLWDRTAALTQRPKSELVWAKL